ncbi:MAG: hypothetical protein IJ527_01735 [Prevotella sp.]|nr:hypothetical protein [Prevotella sp.]
MKGKRKEKFGDLLLDIAKYIITAVILASFFQGIEGWQWYTYLITVTAVALIVWVGLRQYSNENELKSKKKGK